MACSRCRRRRRSRLLGDAPIFSRGPEAELLTPTGALLLTAHAARFGPLPAMRIGAVGYGAGDRDFQETPNVLRVLVGEADEAHAHQRASSSSARSTT